jgi:hypothetical protein
MTTFTATPIAGNPATRPTLPSIVVKFEYEGQRYKAQFTRHDDGRVARIYLLDSGPAFHTLARLASLLLAHGVDLETIRRAVIGEPLAIVLDRIMKIS